MKKNVVFTCLSFVALSLLSASSNAVSFDVKLSGFYPLNSQVRDIYSSFLPDLEMGVQIPFSDHYKAWLSVDYIWNTEGRSLGLGDPTSIKMIPLSVGLKYDFPSQVPHVDVYFGLGAVYSLVWIKNESAYVKQREFKNGFGGVAKVGVCYQWSESVSVEGFIDYMYQYFRSSNSEENPYVEQTSIDLSGLKLGLGLNISL
jgi:hypothetical protein